MVRRNAYCMTTYFPPCVAWLVDQSCWRESLFGLILKPFFRPVKIGLRRTSPPSPPLCAALPTSACWRHQDRCITSCFALTHRLDSPDSRFHSHGVNGHLTTIYCCINLLHLPVNLFHESNCGCIGNVVRGSTNSWPLMIGNVVWDLTNWRQLMKKHKHCFPFNVPRA